ncbi:hypothetical protein EJB05_26973, partial [Eragrostis curvula]
MARLPLHQQQPMSNSSTVTKMVGDPASFLKFLLDSRHPHQPFTDGSERRSYPYVLTETMRNNATKLLDENKLKVIYCARYHCAISTDCWCCLNLKPEALCYDTIKECRDVCRVCNPHCPPSNQWLRLISTLAPYGARVGRRDYLNTALFIY